jgi:hypothetical protein
MTPNLDRGGAATASSCPIPTDFTHCTRDLIPQHKRKEAKRPLMGRPFVDLEQECLLVNVKDLRDGWDMRKRYSVMLPGVNC